MKKLLSTLLIGFLGGASFFIAQQIISKKEPKSLGDKIENYSPPVRSVNFSSASGTSLDFTEAAEVSINAVVHIKTTIDRSLTRNQSADPFYNWFFGNPAQQGPQMGSGSGVIINKDGYIVTNNHVIRDAGKIEVVLNDKRTYIGELIGTDPQTDIALIKIKEVNLPYLSYGNSDVLKVGEWVLAVGNPFNLTSTVTAGIVSAKGRNINILESDPSKGLFPIESFIQTDAAVNPGNSGGALVNPIGELVGINTAIASQTGSYSGYSFAVPVNIVKKVVADLLEFGEVQRAFIGVSIRDIDSEFAEEMGLKSMKGVYVNGINVGSGGEAGGMKMGDIIVKVEGNSVKNTSELQEQIGKYRPGDKVNLTLLRDGEENLVAVTLKNKENSTGLIKKEQSPKELLTSLGASFETVAATELKKLKIANGIKVAKLHAGKLASAGIREGFIITSIDKAKITTLEDLETIIKSKTGGILMEGVYPNGAKAYYGFGL